MKRRKFVQNLGLGSSGLLATGKATASPQTTSLPPYQYPYPKTFEEGKNAEGLHVLKVTFHIPGFEARKLENTVKIKQARLVRQKTYYFEGQEVNVYWLQEAQEKSTLSIKKAAAYVEIELGQLFQDNHLEKKVGPYTIQSNFLLDKEIGELDPASVGIRAVGEKFSLAVLADPQGGLADDEKKLDTRMKIHNAFIEESVHLVNSLELEPAFSIVVGDVCDEQGETKDLLAMNRYLKKLKTPVLYSIGNHETKYKVSFEPGYRMEAFNNYMAAQREMNGMDKLLYSFNLGQWHFIVWPDPLRTNFWETHPHYFDWLERDLEKHQDRPTLFFQHVPMHSVGICPLINYSEPVAVKRLVLDTLAQHGNVKYVLSGHVHIPIKASFKTAVSYRGMQLINLPAAGYRPRAFGEADFYGGPTQGVAIVDIEGKEARVTFKVPTEDEFVYPQDLPLLDTDTYALWLKHKWELPVAENFRNGSFEEGLKHWVPRFVYEEDENPANRREVRRDYKAPSMHALYLYNRCRDFKTTGQDRLPQWHNQVSQALSIRPEEKPELRFSYRLDGANCDFRGFCGAYIHIDGYQESAKKMNLIYANHYYWANALGKYELVNEIKPLIFALPDETDQWLKAKLNLAEDFTRLDAEKRSFASLNIDRLVVSLGVWHCNDGSAQPFGIYFDDFRLEPNADRPSEVEGLTIEPKPEEKIWWRSKGVPFQNIAGEHRYLVETPIRYAKK